ncbi:MAG: ester cyclase [Bacteroidales bacterium]
MKKFNSLILILIVLSTYACQNNKGTLAGLNQKLDSLEKELLGYKAEKLITEMRLVRFDSLDFYIYNNQRWDDFDISHDENIIVHYPDGTTTVGLTPLHLESMKPIFRFAPDTKIVSHPLKFGSGNLTTVIGEMEGTFSKPMVLADGRTIPPTGKKFKLKMCTVGRWDGGKLVEEYLFWDDQTLRMQIGI